jgi:hypothetical protein
MADDVFQPRGPQGRFFILKLSMENLMMEEETDADLKEAIEECSKIVEEKCKRRPYMVIVAKADLGYASSEDQKKRVLKGKASYMYMAKPTLKPDGVSKILIGASKKAVELASKQVEGRSDKGQ